MSVTLSNAGITIEMLEDLYSTIEVIEGATVASMKINKIVGAGDTYYARYWFNEITNKFAYKTITMTTRSGEILGANTVATATKAASTVASTASTTTEAALAVDVGTYVAESETYVAMKGVGTAASGTAAASTSTAGSFVFGKVLPAIGMVATAVDVGLAIDEAIYEYNPDWWWFNVEKLDDIVLGRDGMLPILHNTHDGTTYLTEDAFNQFMSAYNTMGAFNIGAPIEYDDATGELDGYTLNIMHPIYMGSSTIKCSGRYNGHNYVASFSSNGLFSICTGSTHGSTLTFYSNAPLTVHTYVIDSDTGEVLADRSGTATPQTYTFHGNTYELYAYTTGGEYASDANITSSNKPPRMSGYLNRDTELYYLYGEGIVYPSAQSEIPGITVVGNTPTVPTSVERSYPSLWNHRVTTNGSDKDGNNKTINWIPVPMPDTSDFTEQIRKIVEGLQDETLDVTDPEATVPTVTGTLTQTDDGSYDDPEDEEKAKAAVLPQAIIDALQGTIEALKEKVSSDGSTPTRTPNPTTSDPNGTGETDPPLVPAGSISNGMCMVYNPTRAELVALSRFLWSTSFIDLVQKLFASPMDGIIGIHEIYVTPSVGGRANIVCGYVDSGVESNYVDERYVNIDCGTVSIEEYFGTIFDYAYTDIELFLPFVGFVRIAVDEAMRGEIKVKYTADVLTGACLARVSILRDSYEVHAYSFGGNCAAQVPYSSGTNSMIFTSICGAVAGGVTGGIGGAIIGATKESILHGKKTVEKGGGWGPNINSMDDKKPFIIIERNIDATPAQYYKWQGYPLHQTSKLSLCAGFTRATNIHYSGPATAEEVTELERMLSDGIIL